MRRALSSSAFASIPRNRRDGSACRGSLPYPTPPQRKMATASLSANLRVARTNYQHSTIFNATVTARAPRGLAASPLRPCRAPVALPLLPLRRGPAVVPRALDTVREGLTVEKFDELISSHPAVLVDFYTTWCGPCKVVANGMKVLEPSYKGQVEFEKIDAEKNYALAQHFKVNKLPTLLLFQGGQQVDRYEGVLSGQDLDLRLRSKLKLGANVSA